MWIFAVSGRREAGNARKMMPQGVGTLSTPNKPNSGNFIFRHFSDRHFDIGPTFLFHVPTNLPWQLRPNHPSHVVDGSTRLQLGHSGFLPSSTWTPETGTSTPVGTPCQNPNSVGTPCQSSHSPNTAIPAPGCGGIRNEQAFVPAFGNPASAN